MNVTWKQVDLDHLKALVAEGKTARELEPVFGRCRKTIIKVVDRYDLGPWIAKPGSRAGDIRHIPADFAERWQTNSLEALAEHYGRGITTVRLWASRLGLSRPRGAHLSASTANSMPSNFAQMQSGYTIQQLMAHYRVGRDIIRRWMKEAGIQRDRFQQPLRLIKPNAYATSPVDRPHRDSSRAGMAADFLRRFGPVARCDERGRFDPTGTHWRRGSTVLDAAEVIDRAERNGWQPDAWKRVA